MRRRRPSTIALVLSVTAATLSIATAAVATSGCGEGVRRSPAWTHASGGGGTLRTSATSDGAAGGATVSEALPASFVSGPLRLRLEALRDDLVHFELAVASPAPRPSDRIETSPMVDPGGVAASRIRWRTRDDEGGVFETEELRIEVDRSSLCVRSIDRLRGFVLNQLCPAAASRSTETDGRIGSGDLGTSITVSGEDVNALYGLGEQFTTPGATDGDWLGHSRTPGKPQGNAMVKFDGSTRDSGSVGNAQFPIIYATRAGHHDYAMFFDDAQPESWNFAAQPWTMHSTASELRWYVASGPDLADLRRDVMSIVGRPKVPPKKAFGLWISEYGYDDWHELEGKLKSLRAHHFPVDGFVLDLQWFGGVTANSETTRMGTLQWDERHFPEPAEKLRELYAEQGVGAIVIEESYVGRALAEHADLARRGFLVKDCETCAPTFLTENPWWGEGGMIDWSNPAAGDYWHDLKRQALVDAGVIGHWCDLGEPEMFSPSSWYAGVGLTGHRDADVHDLFSLLWVSSIARGYERHGVARRPFMMSRSGAPGMQRFGASMWSGDISTNLTSLAAHLDVQMHMSMSGIDYFGADIGGFIREAARGNNLDETYTQWFADGMAIDVPGRVHTMNIHNDRETAPDRIGHLPSNLASVRRRYELVPYVYSLAHHAHATGDPVFPPLVWGFEGDPQVRAMGAEKLIGPDVLVTTVAKDGARTVDVYLPRDATWVDFTGTGSRRSGGQWLRGVPLYDARGTLRLPIFVRTGAIVPLAWVDEQTWNVLGLRGDGTRHDELRARAFASAERASTHFTLYEDDGETTRYERGEVRATDITMTSDPTSHSVRIVVGEARGSFSGAPAQRDVVLDVVLADQRAVALRVTLDDAPVPAAGATSARGWSTPAPGLVRIQTGILPTAASKTIVVTTSR